MHPTAVVMNMFYTGLGIARSLGARGVPVLGLTAQRGIYGNHTRYAKSVISPDSRREPEALLAFLLELRHQIDGRAVLFPTRDDDVVFLNRFREELSPLYSLVIPPAPAIAVCLDKWQTYLCAKQAGVPTPACWMIESDDDLAKAAREVVFPAVLKPLAAHHWRRARNWEIVGGRKAIAVHSREELLAEYTAIARADNRVLLQEMIPGDDDCLVVTACYITRNGRWAGAFNAQKLIQEPAGFGTGCVVQTAHRPELFEPTMRLLQQMEFSGVAEVEYKWHQAAQSYQLVEVNPRPWDQHSLGRMCGVDLMYLAYADHAGLPMPEVRPQTSVWKWIADDVFVMTAARSLIRHTGRFRSLFRAARGNRIYGIWSARDPLPFLRYFVGHMLPQLTSLGIRQIWSRLTTSLTRRPVSAKGAL
jgi:D-aspartate ligase